MSQSVNNAEAGADEEPTSTLVPLSKDITIDTASGTVFDSRHHEIHLGMFQPPEGLFSTHINFLFNCPNPGITGPTLLSMYAELSGFDDLAADERLQLVSEQPAFAEASNREMARDVLQFQMKLWGLATASELEAASKGRLMLENEIRNPSAKFFNFEDLQARTAGWAARGLRIGIIHGAFDPPNVGHFRLQSLMKGNLDITQYLADQPETAAPPCDILLLGIDPNEYLSKAKGSADDPRPRFPQVYGRLWALMSNQYADAGFVLPISADASIDLDSRFLDMYKALNITRIGTSNGHRVQQRYKEAMQVLWGDRGQVFAWDDEFSKWSSTALFKNMTATENQLFSHSVAIAMYNELESEARRVWKIK